MRFHWFPQSAHQFLLSSCINAIITYYCAIRLFITVIHGTIAANYYIFHKSSTNKNQAWRTDTKVSPNKADHVASQVAPVGKSRRIELATTPYTELHSNTYSITSLRSASSWNEKESISCIKTENCIKKSLHNILRSFENTHVIYLKDSLIQYIVLQFWEH